MIRRYVGIAAIVASLALASTVACSNDEKLTDFTFLPPAPADARFAAFIGPGIWEVVPARGKTYEGTVEYLVEALDSNGKVIASYQESFKRPTPDFAIDHPALSELVTILIATNRQMQNPVPQSFTANPRYMIPSTAIAVRVTVDPNNRVKETHEDNNTFFLKLPANYSTY